MSNEEESETLSEALPIYFEKTVKALRDRADQNYIAARLLYFNGLIPQFFWQGQQCIEQYLKAIALYFGYAQVLHGHKLVPLLEKVRKLDPMLNQLGNDKLYAELTKELWQVVTNTDSNPMAPIYNSLTDFLKHLTEVGLNRYLTKSCYSIGIELILLDTAVYMIRRYCWNINKQARLIGELTETHSKTEKYKRSTLEKLDAGQEKKIFSGLLESIVDNSSHHLHEILLRQNFFLPSRKPIEQFTRNSQGYIHPLDTLFDHATRNPSDEDEFIETADLLMERYHFEGIAKDQIKEKQEGIKKRKKLQ